MHCHADPRSPLRRQEVDHYEGNDRCAMELSLNLTRVSTESCFFNEVVAAYASGPDYADIIAYLRALSDAALEAFIADQARTHSAIYITTGLAPITHQSIRCPSHCDCQRHGLARRYDLQVS